MLDGRKKFLEASMYVSTKLIQISRLSVLLGKEPIPSSPRIGLESKSVQVQSKSVANNNCWFCCWRKGMKPFWNGVDILWSEGRESGKQNCDV